MLIAIVSSDISKQAFKRLSHFTDGIFKVQKTKGLDSHIGAHPDLHFALVKNFVFINPQIYPEFINYIKRQVNHTNIIIKKGRAIPRFPYPYDIVYNIAYGSGYYFHNFKFTDISLKNFLFNNMPIININQGYSGCAILGLEKAIITGDKGIEKIARAYNINTLLIDIQDIELIGFSHGFIGGCCGIYKKNIFFYGSLNNKINGKEIDYFIKEQGYNIISLEQGGLKDLGGIKFINI